VSVSLSGANSWYSAIIYFTFEFAVENISQEEFQVQVPDIRLELSNQMGRPVKYNHLECKTMLARADYLLNIAPKALEDRNIPNYDNTGHKRSLRRVAHGVVLVVCH